MFDCKDADGVDATVTYAKFMSKVELDSDNYPVFLKLLQFENHWVVDSLIGEKDPLYFSPRPVVGRDLRYGPPARFLCGHSREQSFGRYNVR